MVSNFFVKASQLSITLPSLSLVFVHLLQPQPKTKNSNPGPKKCMACVVTNFVRWRALS